MALVDIGGIFYEESTVGSGTGNYNSFLRLQATDEEDGVNTDDPNVGDNKGGIWTHSILLSSLVQVEIDGVFYYEIRLDLNEGNADGDPPITLEDLRIFFSDDPATEDDYDDDFVNLENVFDLGGALNLTDINSGSGTDDYRFLIPVELFENEGAEADDYFTLYSKFSGSDGGFEEWRARSQDVGDGLPIIHVEKSADPVLINEGTPTNITYTYELTNLSPGDDALTVTSFIDDNGTPGETSDDVDLLDGVDATLSPYYVFGDTDLDGLLDKTETWTFTYTREDAVVNAGNLTNVATVNGIDEEGNNTHDDDDAVVEVQDVDPTINIVKTASPTQVQAGTPTLVTFTYAVTNTSPALTDEELTITSLIDDFGTPFDDIDDKDLLLVGTFVGGDTDMDGFLDTGETWTYTYTTNLTLDAGEVRTNVVTVEGVDDEGTSATDNDDASVTGFNLGRTPGFWSNNGAKLWDGNDLTFPKGGSLGTNSIVTPGADLAYEILDLDADGYDDAGAGSRGHLMIGDWNTNGIADPNENVIVIGRADALSLLNASMKQQQDGRFMLARDVVASWLNYLGGSFVGNPDNADGDSVVHHIDQAVAWLIEATNNDHVLLKSELSTATKVGTNTSAWHNGYNFNGIGGFQHDVPPAPDHELGDVVNLDILGGGYLHTSLDHYNNHGFI